MGEYIIIILSSLLMSAFFSGMEIAYFSANRLRIELDRKQSPSYNYIIELFLRQPGQYISTILVGNNIALVVYSLFMSTLITTLVGSENFLLDTLLSTIIIIFVAEFIPKAVVKVNPNFYLRIFALPIFFFFLLFYPLAKVATLLSTFILKVFGLPLRGEPKIVGFGKIDLAALVEGAGESKDETPNENEIKMFQNALDFSDLRVRDCMLPRIEIEGIEVEESIEELSRIVIESQFSRIPVYEHSIDNVIGYVSSKSLFENPENIRQIMRPIIYVPESAPVQKLLGQFTKTHKSMAIVIDEFGGTAGLITIEDILEEIFGNIEDEHDTADLTEKKISDKEYILSGRLEIDYLNAEYGLAIEESDEYDTLAGLILYKSEKLLAAGDEVEIGKFRIKILKASSSKILLVRIIVME